MDYLQFLAGEEGVVLAVYDEGGVVDVDELQLDQEGLPIHLQARVFFFIRQVVG